MQWATANHQPINQAALLAPPLPPSPPPPRPLLVHSSVVLYTPMVVLSVRIEQCYGCNRSCGGEQKTRRILVLHQACPEVAPESHRWKFSESHCARSEGKFFFFLNSAEEGLTYLYIYMFFFVSPIFPSDFFCYLSFFAIFFPLFFRFFHFFFFFFVFFRPWYLFPWPQLYTWMLAAFFRQASSALTFFFRS